LSLYGLELRTGAVAISVPAGTSRKVSGAVLLRDHDREEGARLVEGFAAMSRTRSVVDALRLGSDQHGRRVLDEVLRRGWISAGELRHWCERLRACRGLASLHARASDAECGAWVESERVLHSILTKAGLRGWSFNQEIRAASGRLLGIGDCVNLALKIVIEVDGWAWHTSADRFQRDRDRQNALVEAGWTVLRFTWLDVSTRPDYVATAIRRAMARAA